MRLDKFLSELNIASRKDAKKIVKAGLITVNGIPAKSSDIHIDENSDIIMFKGTKLEYKKYHYLMLNKPSDYVSANEDNLSKTVLELIKEDYASSLFTVGRLDKDTVGLLLLTNDGDFSHRLMSPKHHIEKKYYVEIEHKLTEEDIYTLCNGVELIDDGVTKPAKVEIISDESIYLTITEGKYHQVKRMLAAVNNKVLYLKRVAIGSVNLDSKLNEGEYRELTVDELKVLGVNGLKA